MVTITADAEKDALNPLDLVEQIVTRNDWPFQRHDNEDITVEIAGRWCTYQLWFAFRAETKALHFSCAFDMKVPVEKRACVHHLLSLVNERLWFGHFELWSDDGLPVFQHATLLRGGQVLVPEQIEDMVDIALTEAERFYPAFQHVIWGGKAPDEAIKLALVDTQGEA